MFTKLLCFFKKIVIWDGAHDSWRRVNGYEGEEVVWALNADSLKCHSSECSFSQNVYQKTQVYISGTLTQLEN